MSHSSDAQSMRIEGIYCRVGKDPASLDLLLARLLLFDYSLAGGAADDCEHCLIPNGGLRQTRLRRGCASGTLWRFREVRGDVLYRTGGDCVDGLERLGLWIKNWS